VGRAHELPARARDRVDARDGLHERRVHDLRLAHPERAEEVDPLALHRLLERAAFVRAQQALLRTLVSVSLPTLVNKASVRRRARATPCTCGTATGPRGCTARRSSLLPMLGCTVCGETEKAGVRTLVHGEVAAVAEDDRVHVLALGVVADRARRVVRGQRTVRLRQALRLFHPHKYLCDGGKGAGVRAGTSLSRAGP
jgi:hypothetical protein